jgi:hypothetical protein
VAQPAPVVSQQQQPAQTQAASGEAALAWENPMALAAAIAQNERALVDTLAREQFALSDKDREAFEADMGAAVPQIMARVFLKAQMGALNQIAQVVPRMIEQYVQTQVRSRSNEGAFYRRWPGLKRPELEPVVARLAQTYRMANPQAPTEQMIEDLGPWVMSVAGIAANAAAMMPAGGVVSGNGNHAPQKMAPFVPAVGGPSAISAAAPADPWAILGKDE